MEKKLDGNYTRMLRVILNKALRQHPTKQQLYSHLPPITKTIQVRQARHAGHCWRSRDELKSDVLLWTSTHGRAKAGWTARTYIQQLCEDKGRSPKDLPEAMNDRGKWRERGWDIRIGSMTWWWWYSKEAPSPGFELEYAVSISYKSNHYISSSSGVNVFIQPLPHGHDVTQGHFFRIQTFPFSTLVSLPSKRTQFALLFTGSCRSSKWIESFP